MATELMAITGLTAQQLVDIARSAFAASGGDASVTASATLRRRANDETTALSMRVFQNDGVTPDWLGIRLVGVCPQSVAGQSIV